MPPSFRQEIVAPVEYNDSVTGKESGMSSLCVYTLTHLLEIFNEAQHFMLLLCTEYEVKIRI